MSANHHTLHLAQRWQIYAQIVLINFMAIQAVAIISNDGICIKCGWNGQESVYVKQLL